MGSMQGKRGRAIRKKKEEYYHRGPLRGRGKKAG